MRPHYVFQSAQSCRCPTCAHASRTDQHGSFRHFCGDMEETVDEWQISGLTAVEDARMDNGGTQGGSRERSRRCVIKITLHSSIRLRPAPHTAKPASVPATALSSPLLSLRLRRLFFRRRSYLPRACMESDS